jgi:hypothetical protein
VRVRVISFGSNWWAMHSRDLSDPLCFERRAAYFNAAALFFGRRLRHCAAFPGQVRFNARSGFNPEFPARAIGRTFSCSGPTLLSGKTHLLFSKPAGKEAPDAYLVTLSSAFHGSVPFEMEGWRSCGVAPISISLRGARYEAMLLMGLSDWVESDVGRWHVDARNNRVCLAEGASR